MADMSDQSPTKKSFFAPLKALSRDETRNLIFIALVIFGTLLSYPIVRSTTTAMFLDAFGAKSSPTVWLFSVLVLAGVVSIYNYWQVRLSIHRLFLGTAIFSVAFFLVGTLVWWDGNTWAAWPLFVWKEVYIILMIHMAFGFLNSCIPIEIAKLLYGPMGAMGSLGGVLGGLATSYLTKSISTEWILIIGSQFILISGFLFWFTDRSKCLSKVSREENVAKTTPLTSLRGVRKYALLIAAIVALSQFCINLANFQFNVLFAEIVPDKLEKTRLLGQLYTAINGVGLGVQLILVPLLLRFLSIRTIHFIVPGIYLLVTIFGFGLGGSAFFAVGMAFVFFKGIDYSLFSVGKELLYFPLNAKQKYGAKYITDMVVYRMAKGGISLFLIYVQDLKLLTVLLYGFLALWPGLIVALFRAKRTVND